MLRSRVRRSPKGRQNWRRTWSGSVSGHRASTASSMVAPSGRSRYQANRALARPRRPEAMAWPWTVMWNGPSISTTIGRSSPSARSGGSGQPAASGPSAVGRSSPSLCSGVIEPWGSAQSGSSSSGSRLASLTAPSSSAASSARSRYSAAPSSDRAALSAVEGGDGPVGVECDAGGGERRVVEEDDGDAEAGGVGEQSRPASERFGGYRVEEHDQERQGVLGVVVAEAGRRRRRPRRPGVECERSAPPRRSAPCRRCCRSGAVSGRRGRRGGAGRPARR